ncbi:MAG: Serine/threonine-protein phosphatase [candidate division TM6 bacterium GW2011_GWF2_28_16]|nr:MAG: Serine/threonine-protein phosphatase [candidate division TM6 bacterium GW2011_GWF2_28_16]
MKKFKIIQKINIILFIVILNFLNSNIFAITHEKILSDIVFNQEVQDFHKMGFAYQDEFKILFNNLFNNLGLKLDSEVINQLPENNSNLNTDNASFCYAKCNVVSNSAIIKSCGDLHGSVYHLIINLRKLLEDKIIDDQLNIIGDNIIAFTGDYIDRGSFGIEVLYLLISLYLKNPDKVILLRGNHETQDVAGRYGFAPEFCNKFLNKDDIDAKEITILYNTVLLTLKKLPVTAFVCSSQKTVQLAHGCPDINIKFEFKDINKNRLISLYNGLIIEDESNYFIWGDILSNSYVDRGINIKPIELSCLEKYLIENNINELILGHDHVCDGYDEYGQYNYEFDNGRKIKKHIQNFWYDPVEGSYVGNFISDKSKGYFEPSWVTTTLSSEIAVEN